MKKGDLSTMLMSNLDMITTDISRYHYFDNLIDTAIALIAREGAELSEPFSVEDSNLIVMYAAYLFRKRATDEPMPRMLRWALNNRIFGGKVNGT